MKRRMTLKALVAVGLTGLLGPSTFADAAKGKPSTKMRCSLTGKTVDKCCCEQRDGKTYCTLAGKTVEKCCCEPVAGGTEKK